MGSVRQRVRRAVTEVPLPRGPLGLDEEATRWLEEHRFLRGVRALRQALRGQRRGSVQVHGGEARRPDRFRVPEGAAVRSRTRAIRGRGPGAWLSLESPDPK